MFKVRNRKELIMSAKKPKWVVSKGREKGETNSKTIWLFGLHAVRDAINNPQREKLRLIATQNAVDRLSLDLKNSNIEIKICDPRTFSAPIHPQSVHQGVALEAKPLNWGDTSEICKPDNKSARLIALDRVTDPNNVGAILRSAEVFGAQAVITPSRHSAPETGSLAKSASGALERQPYIRVGNLSTTLEQLKSLGYFIIGLDAGAETDLSSLSTIKKGPLVIVLGAEGPGLREKTKKYCDLLVRIPSFGSFGSLNVSNAAAVALYSTNIT